MANKVVYNNSVQNTCHVVVFLHLSNNILYSKKLVFQSGYCPCLPTGMIDVAVILSARCLDNLLADIVLTLENIFAYMSSESGRILTKLGTEMGNEERVTL